MARKPHSFGERLQKFREAAGLTREELAERVGVRRQHIWRIEGDQQEPTWGLVCRLADALKVATDAFR